MLSSVELAKIGAVAEPGPQVRRVSGDALRSLKGRLRDQYRTLELPGVNPLKDAHTALDTAVLAAYGFDPRQDLLAQLLALNLEVADRLARGEPVTAPGIPAGYPVPAELVTDDCIAPPHGAWPAHPPVPGPPGASLTPEQAVADAAHHYFVMEEPPRHGPGDGPGRG